MDGPKGLADNMQQLNLAPTKTTPPSPSFEEGKIPALQAIKSNETPSILFRLPAEIKNQIFELTMPTNTAICLRVERLPDDGHKRRYRLLPSLPALYSTCRQLRADFPIAHYYSANTFVISDVMFQPAAMSIFRAARRPAIDNVDKVRVAHTIETYRSNRTYQRVGVYVFSASRAGSGQVDFTGIKFQGDEERVGGNSICSCTIEQLAAECGQNLLEFCCKYVEKAPECTIQDSAGYGEMPGRTCRRCGNWQLI